MPPKRPRHPNIAGEASIAGTHAVEGMHVQAPMPRDHEIASKAAMMGGEQAAGMGEGKPLSAGAMLLNPQMILFAVILLAGLLIVLALLDF